MTDQELRAMVRESIARQLGETVRLKPDTTDVSAADVSMFARGVRFQPDPHSNASFVRLPLSSGGDGDGACLIEPSVRCNHCGYCQSYGH
jgi:hypothetical protein